MNETYQNVVVYFPSEKSPDGDTVLLKFHTKSEEIVRLRMSDSVARHLGT